MDRQRVLKLLCGTACQAYNKVFSMSTIRVNLLFFLLMSTSILSYPKVYVVHVSWHRRSRQNVDVTLFWFRHCWGTWAVCSCVMSCWNIKAFLCMFKKGMGCSCSMSFTYLSPFKLFLIKSWFLTVVLMVLQTITLCRSLASLIVQFWKRSPGCMSTIMLIQVMIWFIRKKYTFPHPESLSSVDSCLLESYLPVPCCQVCMIHRCSTVELMHIKSPWYCLSTY